MPSTTATTTSTKSKKPKRRTIKVTEEHNNNKKSKSRRKLRNTVVNEEEKDSLTSNGKSIDEESHNTNVTSTSTSTNSLQPSLDIEKDTNELLTSNGNSLPEVKSQVKGSRIRRITLFCSKYGTQFKQTYCSGYKPHIIFFVGWILSALIIAEIFHRPQVNNVTTHPPTPSDIVLDGYDDQVFNHPPEAPPSSNHPPHGNTPRGKDIIQHLQLISGVEKVSKVGSAQYEAAHWIISVDDLKLFDDDPFLDQRYALALIYFEMMIDLTEEDEDDDAGFLGNGGGGRGGSSNSLSEWLDPTTSECSWSGIKCDSNGFVEYIQLGNHGLRGQIPEEIWVFQQLTYLDLSNNQITGKIPKEVGLLQKLVNLFLDNNYLTGIVDKSLCARRQEGILIQLTTDCEARSTSTTIRRVYCNCCTNCVEFNDNHEPAESTSSGMDHTKSTLRPIKNTLAPTTQLSPPLPGPAIVYNDKGDGIDFMRKQQIFGKCAQISGVRVSISDSAESMATNWMIYSDGLKLNVDSSHFVQRYVIAVAYFSLKRRDIRFDNSWFNTNVHECLFDGITCNSDQKIEELNWGQKKLDGRLPDEISLLDGVRTIDFTDNKIRRDIPKSWKSLASLENLLLEKNDMSGKVEPSICSLQSKALIRFKVDCYKIECSCCTNCDPDQEVDREENIKLVLTFQNNLPTRDKNTKQALNWIIDKDPLRLSSTDERLVQRYVLAVFYSTLNTRGWEKDGDGWMSGKPECEWGGVKCDESSRVTEIQLNNKHLDGPIPYEIGSLAHLTSIDLSNNDITGDVPRSLGKLFSLEKMILDHNKMSGEVPHEVCLLKDNFSLDFLSVDCELDAAMKVSCTCCDRCSTN